MPDPMTRTSTGSCDRRSLFVPISVRPDRKIERGERRNIHSLDLIGPFVGADGIQRNIDARGEIEFGHVITFGMWCVVVVVTESANRGHHRRTLIVGIVRR